MGHVKRDMIIFSFGVFTIYIPFVLGYTLQLTAWRSMPLDPQTPMAALVRPRTTDTAGTIFADCTRSAPISCAPGLRTGQR